MARVTIRRGNRYFMYYQLLVRLENEPNENILVAGKDSKEEVIAYCKTSFPDKWKEEYAKRISVRN